MTNTSNHREQSERTGQSLGDILHGGLGLVPQQGVRGHHHPRGAEATLRAVGLRDSLLGGQQHHISLNGPT